MSNSSSGRFLKINVLHDLNGHLRLSVNDEIPMQGVCAIFGESGSGKTTLLRSVAGLLQLPGSTVEIAGDTWQSDQSFVPAHKRSIAYVMQEDNLLPHLTARQNINYALKRRLSDFGKEFWSLESTMNVVRMMGIENILDRSPDRLSGGEKQRVALTRALLLKPQILLLDEPLSALDDARKEEILPYIERLKSLHDSCILYVTHSKRELARLADRVLMVENGTFTLHENVSEALFPSRAARAKEVVFDAVVKEKQPEWGLQILEVGDLSIRLRDNAEPVGSQIRLCVAARYVSLNLLKPERSSILNLLPATVISLHSMDNDFTVDVLLDVSGRQLWASVSRYSAEEMALQEGLNLWAQIKAAAIMA